MENKSVYFINRESKNKEMENIYGDFFLRLLYQHPVGEKLIPLFCKKWFSEIYGAYQNTKLSAKKIPSFVGKFSINMDEYLPSENSNVEHPYNSFNEFFIRRFKSGKRIFPTEDGEFGAFSEARYYAYKEINEKTEIPVKGQFLDPKKLINNEKWNSVFQGGPLILARLCPVDYHRFHFFDDGVVVDSWRNKGDLHSVNPLALKKHPEIFCVNERHVTILNTKNFGHVAYIEVGAMGVGKIVQNHQGEFKRGDEKGYFLFGGSTVIVVGEKDKWIPSEDIIKNTMNGIETYIKLGDVVARK